MSRRVVVIGAGFIGQEVAATARGRGVEVTLIEAADVPLAHVLGARLGGWFADLHRAEGVRVELGISVADAGPAGAPVERRRLAGGGPGFGEVNPAFEDRVLYPLPWCSRRAQRR